MDEIKRGRREDRGWFTRHNKRVSDIIDKETVDRCLIQEMKELEIKLASVEPTQQCVEIILEDKEFEYDLDEASISESNDGVEMSREIPRLHRQG